MGKMGFRIFGVAVLACLVSSASAVSMKLVNAGPAPAVMGGVYTSPYGVSVNNSPTPSYLICDDFSTPVYINQTWNATVSTLAELQGRVGTATVPQTPKFTTGSPAGTLTSVDVAKYAMAGVLAAQIMTHLSPADAALRGELSFALWSIFDPLALNALTGADSVHLIPAQQLVANAQEVVRSATYSGIFGVGLIDLSKLGFDNLYIYTPSPNLGVSQEFLGVSMPEPAAIAILAIDLLGLTGLVLLIRRRRAVSVQ